MCKFEEILGNSFSGESPLPPCPSRDSGQAIQHASWVNLLLSLASMEVDKLGLWGCNFSPSKFTLPSLCIPCSSEFSFHVSNSQFFATVSSKPRVSGPASCHTISYTLHNILWSPNIHHVKTFQLGIRVLL